MARGGLGSYIFIPHLVLWLEGLKGQDTPGWSKTTRCIYLFPWPYSPKTFQGVLLDSLGVDAIEIGHIIAPNLSPTSPASAKAHFGSGDGIVAFLDRISTSWGPGGSPLVVPWVAPSLGGLKE